MKLSARPTLLLLLLLLFAALAAGTLCAQQGGEAAGTPAGSDTAAAAGGPLEPVFPPTNPAVLFVEGEEAVSTNFATEPILSYSCSGFRTLQLSSANAQQGERAFYATYALYVEEPGRYELWYGGTPPGPQDELFPSYASPFSFRLDGGDARPVYREDVQVVARYAPGYYWNRVAEVTLAAGAHTLDFLVSQRRRHDNRFFFYLDGFFLLRAGGASAGQSGPLPRVFPQNLADRSIDFAFRPLEDYQIAIRDNPASLEGYLEIAEIYALLADYLNALKYLKRAELVAPGDERVELLLAKNRIWKGEVVEGLKGYRELLLLNPQRLDLWLEAGKVAAWTGRYQEAEAFFRGGLEHFPEELGLVLNLGLTFLWAGRLDDAERELQRAQALAEGDVARVLELARVYEVNGYPERSVPLLQAALRRYPEHLELYLLLERVHLARGQSEKAEEVRRLIAETFQPSPQLARVLELARRREQLKQEVITGYEAKMRQEPENLALRELLAQTYFWNGERRRAIAEYHRLLANYAFLEVTGLDQDSARLLDLLDRNALRHLFLARLPEALKSLRGRLGQAGSALEGLEREEERLQARLAAAREKGEELVPAEGAELRQRREAQTQELAQAVARGRELAAQTEEELTAARRDRGLLQEEQEREKQEAEAFESVVGPLQWRWDRRAFLAEFGSMEGALADSVLGRVALSEGRLADAEGCFRAREGGETIPPETTVGLFRSLLWQEKPAAAFELAARLDPAHSPEGWEELEALQASFLVEPASASSLGAAAVGPDPGGAIRSLLADLDRVESAAAEAERALRQERLALQGMYGRRLLRAMYRFEENTFLIRNQLGDYYLKEQDYPAAILQFRRVLAVDPWNVDAVYRLGKVYEWSGDWRQAMRNFQKVYYTDPGYEDVTAQYNRLARQHADSLEVAAWHLADNARLETHAQLGFTHPLTGLLGVRFLYEADNVRIYDPLGPESPSNYLVQGVTVGLPLSLAAGRLTLAPVAGLRLTSDLYGGAGLPPAEALSALDYLQAAGLEPFAGLDLSAALGDYVYLEGGYRWGRNVETLVPGRARILEHAGELDVNASLGFIPLYPFTSSALRTHGELRLESDDNLLYSVGEELALGLLRLEDPQLELSLLGNVLFENSRFEQVYLYYTPWGVLLATGGVKTSAWLSVGEESSVDLGLRVAGGSYQERLLTPGETIRRLQLEVQADAGFTRGKAHYYLQALFSSTYKYEQAGAPAGAWDYWSFYVTLGVSTALPRLLAP